MQCTNDAGYDTEHTSLNSDFDEAELRRELLRDVSFKNLHSEKKSSLTCWKFESFSLLISSIIHLKIFF